MCLLTLDLSMQPELNRTAHMKSGEGDEEEEAAAAPEQRAAMASCTGFQLKFPARVSN